MICTSKSFKNTWCVIKRKCEHSLASRPGVFLAKTTALICKGPAGRGKKHKQKLTAAHSTLPLSFHEPSLGGGRKDHVLALGSPERKGRPFCLEPPAQKTHCSACGFWLMSGRM